MTHEVPMSAKELVKLLKEHGWLIVGQNGSHIYLKHEKIKGKVTVPNHKQLKIGTQKAIKKQAGLI